MAASGPGRAERSAGQSTGVTAPGATQRPMTSGRAEFVWRVPSRGNLAGETAILSLDLRREEGSVFI